jgi:outer membrane protein assembly factor BamB
MRTRLLLLLLIIIIPPIDTQAAEENPSSWPAWRAVSGNNVIPSGDYPVTWSAKKNVAWKTALPDKGNSSPVVAGKRVFLTQAIESENKRGLICLDSESGKTRWERYVVQQNNETTHKTNPYCSASPMVSEDRVVCWLGNSGVYTYDLEGNEQWHRDLGPIEHVFGYGSSPVIYKDTCYLNFGPGKNTFIIALAMKDGKELWRRPVTVDVDRYPKGDIEGSYATPAIVTNMQGAVELITTYPGYVVSLDPASGDENWRCGGLDYNVHGSPAVANGVVIALGGFMYESIAVRMGGRGNVTQSHRLWQIEQSLNGISTPIIVGDHFYRVGRSFASCHDVKTGKELWKGRYSDAQTWASPTLVGDMIYIVDQTGTTSIFKANPEKFELLSQNPSDDAMTNGSLAFADNAIYLRTHKHLWKFTQH